MSDDAAKGFRCSASLDEAVAESAALCATPIYTITRNTAVQRSTADGSHISHHDTTASALGFVRFRGRVKIRVRLTRKDMCRRHGATQSP